MSVVTPHTLPIELGDVSPSLALLDSVDVAIRDAIVIRNRLEGFTLSETLPRLARLEEVDRDPTA